MNPSAVFIRRPVATRLIRRGIALSGMARYFTLSVAAAPAADVPSIFVQPSLPAAAAVAVRPAPARAPRLETVSWSEALLAAMFLKA